MSHCLPACSVNSLYIQSVAPFTKLTQLLVESVGNSVA